ncbi:MAG TPA: shikimate kinase [Candidatus Acidoferrales bacterium]|nr:shikimate kinase [Candidatus Acidoferrales bacterium]
MNVQEYLSGERRQVAQPMIVLIGFMGAGKSSVGRELARIMGTSFADLDEEIVRTAGRSIAEIFQYDGETEFRRIEREQLRVLLEEADPAPGVLALGGGAFVQFGNEELLRDNGAIIVFLDASVEELQRRCHEPGVARPLAASEKKFRELYEERRDIYARAHYTINTQGRTVEQVAHQVMLLAVPSRHRTQ